jgi:diketogulonate reductase-like aldo/keto reductase
VLAYTPLGGNSARDPTLERIGAARGCSAAAVALAWTTRSGNVIAIPESGSATHVKENAIALSLTLTPEDLQTLDAAHPPPSLYELGLKYWTRRVLRALSRPSGE